MLIVELSAKEAWKTKTHGSPSFAETLSEVSLLFIVHVAMAYHVARATGRLENLVSPDMD